MPRMRSTILSTRSSARSGRTRRMVSYSRIRVPGAIWGGPPAVVVSNLHLDAPEFKIHVVVRDHQVFGLQLPEARGVPYRLAGGVHVGLWKHHTHRTPARPTLPDDRVPTRLVERDAELARRILRDAEADVVPGRGVFRTRISQADEEAHKLFL